MGGRHETRRGGSENALPEESARTTDSFDSTDSPRAERAEFAWRERPPDPPNSAQRIQSPRARARAGRGKDSSLAPNLRERIGALVPGPPPPRGTRALLARRIAAAALFVLAGVLAVLPTGRSGEPGADVRLTGAEPVTTEPADTGPAGAPPEPGQVAVPVRLADPGVADLLHPGVRVDLVTNPEGSAGGSVLAERAPVLAVRTTGSRPDQGRLVLLGIPEQRAPAVAGASLIHSVTVTLR
ncbi:hypothetical protein GCM10027271_16620 [Saccharopolyspora gloriosae]|uniref:SAF domain-containing protein n=1 Tax=Saccharopolyspora gloriosae TaxID=455344 RepID=A0A840NA03_9PSEU|nr:hypothetical protein [Saccharopolyspora gloriosae]MBB5067213.1 hypothetical protein [Saccharopolyspora gloriosae]